MSVVGDKCGKTALNTGVSLLENAFTAAIYWASILDSSMKSSSKAVILNEIQTQVENNVKVFLILMRNTVTRSLILLYEPANYMNDVLDSELFKTGNGALPDNLLQEFTLDKVLLTAQQSFDIPTLTPENTDSKTTSHNRPVDTSIGKSQDNNRSTSFSRDTNDAKSKLRTSRTSARLADSEIQKTSSLISSDDNNQAPSTDDVTLDTPIKKEQFYDYSSTSVDCDDFNNTADVDEAVDNYDSDFEPVSRKKRKVSTPKKSQLSGLRQRSEKPMKTDETEDESIASDHVDDKTEMMQLSTFHIPKCSECSVPFATQSDLIAHIKSEHPGFEVLPCNKCTKVFTSQKAMRKHGLDVHRKNKQCPQCTKRFAYQYELDQHLRSHRGLKPFKCELCSCAFPKRTSLNAHMRLKHPGAEVKGSTTKVKIEAPEEETLDNPRQRSRRKSSRPSKEISYTEKDIDSDSDSATVQEESFLSTSDISTNDNSALAEVSQDILKNEATNDASNYNIQCKLCDRSFSHGKYLQRHIKRIHEKRYACQVCQRKFSYPQELAEHAKLHTNAKDKFVKCDFCDRPFRTRNLALTHAKVQHKGEVGELRFECVICSLKFTLSCLLVHHTETVHKLQEKVDPSKTFLCQICFMVFPNEEKLARHDRIEHGTNPTDSGNQQNGESQSSTPKEPYQENSTEIDVLSEISKKTMCLKCGEQFESNTTLAAHRQEKHSNEGNPEFTCQSCGKMCENKETLRNHIRRVHSKKRQCKFCDAKFAFKYLLDRHLLTHTGEKNFACELCKSAFYSMKELNVHVRLSHKEKTFTCDFCTAKFSTKQSRERHMMHRHTDYRPLRCEFCGKGFVDKRELNAHIFTHTKVSDIRCEKCGKMFGTMSGLNKHIRFVHNGEKRLCPICGKHITSHLGMHIKSHGEKRYKCDQCPKVYAWPAALKEHMRTHTGEKPYVCPICSKSFLGSANFVKHKKIHAKNGGGLARKQPEVANNAPEVEPQMAAPYQQEQPTTVNYGMNIPMTNLMTTTAATTTTAEESTFLSNSLLQSIPALQQAYPNFFTMPDSGTHQSSH